jgi:hypothetical protein
MYNRALVIAALNIPFKEIKENSQMKEFSLLIKSLLKP